MEKMFAGKQFTSFSIVFLVKQGVLLVSIQVSSFEIHVSAVFNLLGMGSFFSKHSSFPADFI